MDANTQRQKGLLLFLSSFLVVCHAASRQIHVQSKSSAKMMHEENNNASLFIAILDQNGTVRGIFNGVVRDV